MKGVMISFEFLAAVMIFSTAFSLFLLKTMAAQQTVVGDYTSTANRIAMEAKVQNAVSAIDRLDPDINTAQEMLNNSIPYEYTLKLLTPVWIPDNLTVNRVVIIAGKAYLLEVGTR